MTLKEFTQNHILNNDPEIQSPPTFGKLKIGELFYLQDGLSRHNVYIKTFEGYDSKNATYLSNGNTFKINWDSRVIRVDSVTITR